MKILFITENEISPNQGGVGRITHVLTQEFMARGDVSCSLAYVHKETLLPLTYFDTKVQLQVGREVEMLLDLLHQQAFDMVISNLGSKVYIRLLLPAIYAATRNTSTRIIACYHVMPGYELVVTPLHTHRQYVGILEFTRSFLANLGLTKRIKKRLLRTKYRQLYQSADKVVVLSSKYITPFADLAGVQPDSKLVAIPNMLSFPESIDEKLLLTKAKEVLIVSRLDESSKRLSRALQIWQLIHASGEFTEWTLRIVGDGPDLHYYQSLVDQWHLPNVVFEGVQKEVIPFYRKAAIFMMTSAHEGFGITLTEAQQMGVVPIAFKSYASLTDIIMDGQNGYVITDGDTQAYAHRLADLMRNPDVRLSMAQRGLKDCQRFASKPITDKWFSLFKELMNHA